MEKRRLGRTGLDATIVGLGGAPISRRNCSDAEAMRTVWGSLEAGMNLIDTSPLYGLGRSEILIGKALRERPDLAANCYLSTKTGNYGWHNDYSYSRTRRSVALSLKRLGADYLDIVHIHDVHQAAYFREIIGSKMALAALQRYKEEGVIGAIGVGTKALEVHNVAIESGAFDVLMIANQYNLLKQAAGDTIARAAQKDVGVIIAGAYATGILAKGSADLASHYGYRPASEEIRVRVAEVEALCQKWRCALPTTALRFCLRAPHPGLITVLGARTPEQTQQNATRADDEVPEGFWADLDELLASDAEWRGRAHTGL